MSKEASIRTSLQISKGNLKYQSQPVAFTADVTTANPKGPTPGSITVSIGGTTISLAQLTAYGGLCRIMNKDATNYVEVGSWDGVNFVPVLELLPGESFVLRLSRHLGKEYGTGTGTGTGTTYLRLKANTAACDVLVEAFDK